MLVWMILATAGLVLSERESSISQGVPDFGLNRDFSAKAQGMGSIIKACLSAPSLSFFTIPLYFRS